MRRRYRPRRCSGTACRRAARRSRSAQKHFGIWHASRGREFGAARARDRHGAGRARLRAGRMRLDPLQHQPRMALRRPGHPRRGGVSNGIYPTDAPPQVEYLLRGFARPSTCSSRTKSSSTRCSRCARGCRSCARSSCSTWTGCAIFDDPQVISLDALRALGREHDAAHPGEWERRIALRKPDDLAILVYTSGTTGKPKGAMHFARQHL